MAHLRAGRAVGADSSDRCRITRGARAGEAAWSCRGVVSRFRWACWRCCWPERGSRSHA